MDLGIKDKVAIVTGASTGIGEAVARELARNGVRVVITARGAERLKAAAERIHGETGSPIVAEAADVTDPDAAERLVEAAVKRLGGVDIVVNNAGRAQAGGLLETTDGDWTSMEDVKIHAMVRLNRAAIPHMRRKRWGRIVNMSSIGGIYPNPKLLISHVLSAAINNLTKGLALEVAAHGILVNAIAIGAIQTDNWADNMIPKVRETRPDLAKLDDAALIGRLGAELTPVGRFGTPDEIAAVAAFLASARNGFVTGCTIEASGGADRFM